MKNKLTFFLFIAYCLLLVRLVVFKGPLSVVEDHFRNFGRAVVKTGYASANFIPFNTLYYYLSLKEDAQTGFQNIGGNILLFIPFGFLLRLAFFKLKDLYSFIVVVVLTSLFFEILQLLFAIGNFDVDDLLLNLVGGLIGFGIFSLFARRFHQMN